MQGAGFGGVSVTDRTPQMFEWMASLKAAQGNAPTLAPAAPGVFNLVAMVLGADAPKINANVAQNFQEDRARIAQFVARKS